MVELAAFEHRNPPKWLKDPCHSRVTKTLQHISKKPPEDRLRSQNTPESCTVFYKTLIPIISENDILQAAAGFGAKILRLPCFRHRARRPSY